MQNPRLAGLFVLLATSTHAQWLHYPTPGTPRTRDGKPNLAAKVPRAPNGKPDLSGVWQAEYAPPGENERPGPRLVLLLPVCPPGRFR